MMKPLYTIACALFCIIGLSAEKPTLPSVLTAHENRALFTKLATNEASPVFLFDGKDLIEWYTYTEMYGINNDIEQEFNLGDSLLHLSGKHKGYICTNDAYKNYYLKVVFRWEDSAAHTCGIRYHIPLDADDKLWPESIACEVTGNDCRKGWNTIEIICFDDKSEQYINGKLIAQSAHQPLSEGKILLQQEGCGIYLKTVELIPLK